MQQYIERDRSAPAVTILRLPPRYAFDPSISITGTVGPISEGSPTL
jgi:hypothetical protein